MGISRILVVTRLYTILVKIFLYNEFSVMKSELYLDMIEKAQFEKFLRLLVDYQTV